jgi:ribosome biogenesis protein BMS1
MEDITSQEAIRLNPKCDRNVVLYGYVRGIPLKKDSTVHIAGFGDIKIDELQALPDPCPMPSREKKRNLLEKERLLYAPMSGVGGIVYDKDAVYIELQGSHSHSRENKEQSMLVKEIIDKKQTFDEQIQNQEFRLFSDGDVIKSMNFQEEDDALSENESEQEAENDDSGMDSEPEDENDENLGWNPNEEDDEDEEEGEEGENQQEESSDEEYQDFDSNWKEGLADKARDAYLERQSNNQSLMKLVYGKYNQKSFNDDQEEGEDDEIGGLFRSVSKSQTQIQQEKQQTDLIECPFFEKYGGEGTRNWLSDENKNLIVNKFVTGKWKASEDAEQLLALDDMSDGDSEVYGDFEDLETGEKFEGKNKGENNSEEKEEKENSRKREREEEMNMTRAELVAKKLKLKAKFDAEYDNPELKDSTRVDGDDDAFYEKLKSDADKQAEINKKEFEGLDDDIRNEIEGFRAGLYVRLGFKNMPCEFVENFDPYYPILIGALNMSEENVGLVSCKVKKHRWYRKLLKTADPLIISLGWRRFQTVPIYAKIEDDLKHRYLKYTPNHVTCNMSFYGPITPQNTGFLAVQTVTSDIKEMKRIGFRIAATGAVNEIDKSSAIVKKLKLVGTPFKIFHKSAFVSGKKIFINFHKTCKILI